MLAAWQRRRQACRTAAALKAAADSPKVTAVASFDNYENTYFTLAHFSDGTRERLDDATLAARLRNAIGIPEVPGSLADFW